MEDGLIRDWPNPAVGVEKHKAYAFQWYALSLMAFIFFIVTGYRSGKEKK
jgi:cytochrome oxidase assembly protein ShyY1